MNKGMLGVGIIILGLIALLLVNIVSNYSSGGELDYYLLKETTEAALTDSLDGDFETTYGIQRMDKEKFVESFLRRFADNVDKTRTYYIQFIDLNEVPPKVSVRINSNTVLEAQGEAASINTQLDQIVEASAIEDAYSKNLLKETVH